MFRASVKKMRVREKKRKMTLGESNSDCVLEYKEKMLTVLVDRKKKM